MAIVTLLCDGNRSVHDETARLCRLLAQLGLAPVAIGPGTIRNLKLSFAIEFKTSDDAARFRAAVAKEAPPVSG